MFAKIEWRVSFLVIVFSIIIFSFLAFLINQDSCAASDACVRRNLLLAFAAFIVAAFVVGYVVSQRTTKPIRQLTDIANRVTEGELNARILPRTQDEMSELTSAFNQMTETLGEQLTLLREEHTQLATAVNYMADGVIITDVRGYVLLINPAASRLLESDEQESLGRSFAEVVRHHQLIELFQRCQTTHQEQTEAIELGKDLFLRTIVTPFEEADAYGYLVVLQNLTPVRRLQTVRRDFISNISHELRTPLASLRAVVETLQDHAIEEPQLAQRFLGRAETEIDVMTQMVEELLELSRIESGQVPLRLETTAVSPLILSPVDRIQEMAKRERINLVVDLPADLPYVLADSKRIQQVMTNLLHNAIKFTDAEGTIHIGAFTKSRRFPGQVVISVQDDGSGIPLEDIPRIFERFYKSDRARNRQQGGTGLGLAISRHIVNAHNGHIWVKSKEKKGSTFFFTLPQAAKQPMHKPSEMPTTE